MAINRCQYWNVNEPYACVYWDADACNCTYASDKADEILLSVSEGASIEEWADASNAVDAVPTPIHAPYCNYLGTTVSCKYYKSSNPGKQFPRCILPDPSRHDCNRWTGKKWVTISDGVPDFSVINGYNDGKCNGNGTDTTCSGYAPQHMGFGRLVPSGDGSRDIKSDGTYSPLSEFSTRLPLHFEIFNLRAKLSKCMFWEGEYAPFTVNSGTKLIELSGEWSCKCEEDTSAYEKFSLDNGAPCNGCKPECPYYSGVCWEYCVDDLLESGDPVLAEQIIELRYYCKENQWTQELIKQYYGDEGEIFTWQGTHAKAKDGAADLSGKLSYTINSEDSTIEEYQIASVKTYQDTFNTLDIKHENVVLTKGTDVDSEEKTFPDLVKIPSLTQLNPIIKNRFETDDVFEVTKFGEAFVMLYGKVFSSGDVFVINISHEDVRSSIPNELFVFESLADIKADKGTLRYNQFYTEYEKTIRLLKTLVVSSRNVNKLSADENTTFVLEAPLYPKRRVAGGINTLVVFHDSSEGLLFSKIDVEKRIVGGALIQNDFVMEGDGKAIRDPRDYTQGFYANVNAERGCTSLMSFDFVSLSTGSISFDINYYYDDTYFGDAASETVYSGFKYYKIYKESYTISDFGDDYVDEFFLLGDDGYILIILDLLELTRVFQPWECGDIYATYEDGSKCYFDVAYSGGELDCMEVNQLIIKPKNKADFKSICSATLTIEDLTFYKKLSFDEEPLGTWEYELLNDSEDINYNKVNYTAETSKNSVKITDFQFIMTPSVVISNSVGRCFNIFRTKPIGWVKQPKCPAVEIYYSWGANYTNGTNVPVCTCCGPAKTVNDEIGGYGMAPPCGDHDISMFSGIGPMWWPFNTCDSYTTYNIINNLDNYSYDVIGLFKQSDGDGNKIHGDHDMRMLGPPTYRAWHGRGCNFLMACRCNFRTFNAEKSGDNFFTGFGRLRSGVSDYELQEWSEEGSVLPKFGNPHRPQLDSYLTLEKTQYQYTRDGKSWQTGWRLMPAFMGFSKSDFLEESGDYLWQHNASTIEGAAPVCNPLGFFTASSFEGTNIGEIVDNKNRFTLGEICHARMIVDGISYPKASGTYTCAKKKGTIYPWYEFKSYNPPKTVDDLIEDVENDSTGDPTIQWAWQEKWSPIERLVGEQQTKSAFIRSFLTDSVEASFDGSLGGPFITNDVGNVGMFKFLDIEYPKYLYNCKTEEFTTTTDEGYHYINFIAPEKDESTGEYTGYIKIQLDGGPVRGISWNAKDWLDKDNVSDDIEADEEEYNFEIHSLFTGQEDSKFEDGGKVEKDWFDEVTLFGTGCPTSVDGAEDVAEGAGRMVKSYYIDMDENEVERKTHYQRGLAVNINSDNFKGSVLPTLLKSVGTNVAEQNDIGSSDEPSVTPCGMGTTSSVTASFDEKVKTIAAVEVTYTYGAIRLEDDESVDDKKVIYKYYHIPAISVYTSSDGTTKETLLYEDGAMTLYLDKSIGETVETKSYSWDNSLDYLLTGSTHIIIEFRTTPNSEELAALTESELAVYNSSVNYISYNVYDIYEAILTNASEPIRVWERKYYVSYGNSGDSPPQGFDPENTSTLFALGSEKSTVYNKDYADGVLNMSGSDADDFTVISKLRGRKLGKLYEDNARLDGDVWALEDKQKKLFDSVYNMSVPYAYMGPAISPSLSKLLDEEGMCFYGPPLTLENSLMAELAEINQFEPMNGEGHQYIADYSGYELKCYLFCGSGESKMEWVFTCMDDEADAAYTGQGYQNAAYLFYWGTYNYLQRRDAAEATIENVFNKKYGGSTATKIWVSDEQSELLFPTLYPQFLDVVPSSAKISYNMEYLKLSMNWQNAYFNTAENYEPEGPVTIY